MNCELARERIEDGDTGAALRAHLVRCAACRAEADFSRRLAAAVAAMPRVSAPESFAASVMAEVRQRPAEAEFAPRPHPLTLRSWELGWIGAALLLLLALLPVALGRWAVPPAGSSWTEALAWAGDWGSTLRAQLLGWRGATSLEWDRFRPAVQALPEAALSVPALWLWGAVGFVLALHLLLSWRPNGTAEDAHA